MASATATTVKTNVVNMAILPWPEAPAHRSNMLLRLLLKCERYHRMVDCGAYLKLAIATPTFSSIDGPRAAWPEMWGSLR